MKTGFDLKRFILLYKKKLFKYVICGMVFGTVLFLLADIIRVKLMHPEKMYRSDAMYYLHFTEGDDEVKHYYNDYTWNDVLASEKIAGRAAKNAGCDLEEIKAALVIPTMSDIRIIHVYADGKTKEKAEAYQDAVSEALLEFGLSTEGFDSIEAFSREEAAELKVNGYYLRWAFIGALIGMAAGILLALWKAACDDGIYLEGDLERYLGISASGAEFKDNGHYTDLIKEREEALKANLEAAGASDDDIFYIKAGTASGLISRQIEDEKIKGRTAKAYVIKDADASLHALYYGKIDRR